MNIMIRRSFVVLVNIIFFLVLLMAIELSFRLYYFISGRTGLPASSGIIQLQFIPYGMTGSIPYSRSRLWTDVLHNRTLSADVATNNAGFSNIEDFDIAKPYTKKTNEKVVLFAGGSTAFGVGATSNSTITHMMLEKFLNSAQSDVHYTVINLAQGGWIAQQETIALDIWGRLFNPDWVITLDGANDATVGCAMSQGTGNPVYFQLLNSLVAGYIGTQIPAVFYRGFWENQLIKYSQAYRSLTGKRYVPPPAHLDKAFDNSLLQVVTPTLLSEVRRQVDFYALSEESILERFQDAKFILTTQPVAQDFAYQFGNFYRDDKDYSVDSEERHKFSDSLESWLQSSKPDETYCSGAAQTVGVSTRYVLAMGAIRLADLVERFRVSNRRDVEYYNTGLLYPKELTRRANYFIDNYHLNDAGMEYLARFYAYRILQRDFSDRDWSALRPQAQWFQ